MRIIAGEARGRKLFAPEGSNTRPTSDRVRESLFNILGSRTVDATVLDLFAGSGALALEAISRGAAFAALCDMNRQAAEVIERNIRLVNAEEKTVLVRSDWRNALTQLRTRRFSLVFLDPPYRLDGVYKEAADLLAAMNLLEERALLVMEHAAKTPLVLSSEFELFDERRYGDTAIAFVRRNTDDRRLPGQL